jgi:hypothetical protein
VSSLWLTALPQVMLKVMQFCVFYIILKGKSHKPYITMVHLASITKWTDQPGYGHTSLSAGQVTVVDKN